MERRTEPLESLRIETPCNAPWEAMEGDARRRFCDQCQLHVHNSAALSRAENEELLAARASGDRVCMRIERRPDGSLVTTERFQGLRRAASWLLMVGAGLLAACKRTEAPEQEAQVEPPTPSGVEQPGTVEPFLMGEVELGDVCLPAEELLIPVLNHAPAPIEMGKIAPRK